MKLINKLLPILTVASVGMILPTSCAKTPEPTPPEPTPPTPSEGSEFNYDSSDYVPKTPWTPQKGTDYTYSLVEGLAEYVARVTKEVFEDDFLNSWQNLKDGGGSAMTYNHLFISVSFNNIEVSSTNPAAALLSLQTTGDMRIKPQGSPEHSVSYNLTCATFPAKCICSAQGWILNPFSTAEQAFTLSENASITGSYTQDGVTENININKNTYSQYDDQLYRTYAASVVLPGGINSLTNFKCAE